VAGLWNISSIQIQNAALQFSSIFENLEFTVQTNLVATTPTLSVSNPTNTLTNGGYFSATVSSISDAPVNWLFNSVIAPNNHMYLGGGGYFPFSYNGPYSSTKSNFITTYTCYIPPYVPSGTWTVNLTAVNDGGLSSTQATVLFQVSNQFQPPPPQLNVKVTPTSTSKRDNQILLKMELDVQSSTSIKAYFMKITGPNDFLNSVEENIYFKQVLDDRWQYNFTAEIPSTFDGNYVISNTFVDSEALLYSNVFPNITVSVLNGKVDSIKYENIGQILLSNNLLILCAILLISLL